MIAKILEIVQETPNTRTFKLKPKVSFSFLPGQFLMVGLKGDSGNKILQRAYSIASAPGEKTLDITLNLVPEGKLSPCLFKFKVGDELEIKGPYGKFVLDDKAKSIVMMAGGTGITPFRSFWRYLISKKLGSRLTIIYSCRTENDIIYKKELEEIKKSGVKVMITLTRVTPEQWCGNIGRISAELVNKSVKSLEDSTFYLCGPPDMVKCAVETLKNLGIDEKRINKERW